MKTKPVPAAASLMLLDDADLAAVTGADKKRSQTRKTEPVKYLTVTMETAFIS